jgi:putative acyl-CoA dehydrogenase
MHAAPWGDARPGAHVVRAAKLIAWSSVDYGHTCPISMTYSVVASLRHAPDLAAEWEPGLHSLEYDPRPIEASLKKGLTAGMAMTEKQGGSDVRANTTVAEPDGDGGYLLTGHKWFVSAPMSDVFLALAQAPDGLTCVLLPRVLPGGSPNPFAIQRLKDKMGDRSNASSEVELDGTWAVPVGEEGRGVRTIIEMVNRTRLDCSLGVAAQMRHGLVEAVHHARHRDAFGTRLADAPAMLGVLADLALESEAATAAAVRLARAFDERARGVDDGGFHRIATPVIKYWLCKRSPGHAAEALECLGGSGYVEESSLPRLFRQSPLNGVWEGSGNVICLDVLRAMHKEPAAVEVLLDDLGEARGGAPAFDAAIDALRVDLEGGVAEAGARRMVERLAVLLQASLLLRHAPSFVADAFVAARIAEPGVAYGSLPAGVDVASILERAVPA